MPTYEVQTINGRSPQVVIADEWNIDDRGNLNFWNKALDRRIFVFANGQWQHVKEN